MEQNRLQREYEDAMHNYYPYISEWAAEEDEEDRERNENANLSTGPENSGPPSGPNNGGGHSNEGASDSGIVQFTLVNIEDFVTIIIPFVSIIIAINPEIFMYVRLIITLVRDPAFNLYMYFKYINFLAVYLKFFI